MKLILANMPVINGNRGCVALSISTMHIIDEILSKRNIEYQFFLPDSGYKGNGKHSYEVKDRTIKFYSCNYPVENNVKSFIQGVYKFIFKNSEFVENQKIFKEANYIFDIGQGDSFADIYGKKRFGLIDRIHKIARSKNKPYCILPQTIGPFENQSVKLEALQSVNNASVVMARDLQSYNYVKENCPDKTIKEYIDVAFFMPFEKRDFGDQFIHVGLNVSGLLWNGGYTKNNQFGLKVDYQNLTRNIIDYFLSLKDVKLHLVGHVVGSESNVENDYEVSYKLYKEYNFHENIILAPLFFSPIEAKSYIAGMEFFMGARMHAAIGAFSSGTAVLPLSYSRKFNGLFVDTLQYTAMGDMKVDNNDEILSKIKWAFAERVSLKNTIDQRLSTIVKEREDLLRKEIESFLNLK